MAKNVDNLPLQQARSKWFIDAVSKLMLDTPGRVIASELDEAESAVSRYLTGKRFPPVKFLEKFCEAYGYDYTEVNMQLIEQIRDRLLVAHGGQPEGSNADIKTHVNEKQDELENITSVNENLSGSSLGSLPPLKPGDESMQRTLLEILERNTRAMEALAEAVKSGNKTNENLSEILNRSSMGGEEGLPKAKVG